LKTEKYHFEEINGGQKNKEKNKKKKSS